MEEDMKRQQFTCYRSYYEALKLLPDEYRLAAYDAIFAYGLDGEELLLEGISAAAFILIKPTLDSGRKKAKAGKHGGKSNDQPESNHEANEKQNESKPETNVKQAGSEIEIEEEKEVEVEKENECYISNTTSTQRADAEFGKVMSLYMDRVQAHPSSSCIELLKDYTKDLSADVVIHAINKALDDNKAGWSYIQGILRHYSRDGIRSIEAAQREEQRFREEKERNMQAQKNRVNKTARSDPLSRRSASMEDFDRMKRYLDSGGSA